MNKLSNISPSTIAHVRDSVIDRAWACVPQALPAEQRTALKARAAQLLRELGAVLVSHYYVDADLQDLALETGGCVSDSLEMARFGRDHAADMLIVAGVRFMGETSKILSPDKRVFMPALEAECSLDLGCPADEFAKFCDAHPDRTVVVYANTSAAVKARADWCVTSSVGLDIVRHLHEQGQKILWAPDKHLGRYIQEQTGADMVLWPGVCIVHDEFKGAELELLKAEHPEAKVLVHPESPRSVVQLADVVGSTSQMLNAARSLPAREFIVATDKGLLHSMRKAVPEKIFIEAPTAGDSATCKSCAHCPWMAMNDLTGLVHLLEDIAVGKSASVHGGEIQVDPALGRRAYTSIDRMLGFAAAHKTRISTFASAGSEHIGPA